jgi:hypothetical protein
MKLAQGSPTYILQVSFLVLGLSIQYVDCLPFNTPFSSAQPPVISSWKNPKKKREYISQDFQTPLSNWSGETGDSALRQVQYLASKVAESTAATEGRKKAKSDSKSVAGTGGRVYNNAKYNGGASKAQSSRNLQPDAPSVSSNLKQEDQVWTALANLELDSKTGKSVICKFGQETPKLIFALFIRHSANA